LVTFDFYDKFTAETDTGHYGTALAYPTLGLAGEAGEFADKVKKLWRNKNIQEGTQLSEEDKQSLELELGDVMWYVSALARRLGSSLENIAEKNITKLRDRKARGVIRSEGDNR
jgi:NTP pyrophosphatase (non-canonical NTP hydrolase)